jgi:hypothetical protein
VAAIASPAAWGPTHASTRRREPDLSASRTMRLPDCQGPAYAPCWAASPPPRSWSRSDAGVSSKARSTSPSHGSGRDRRRSCLALDAEARGCRSARFQTLIGQWMQKCLCATLPIVCSRRTGGRPAATRRACCSHPVTGTSTGRAEWLYPAVTRETKPVASSWAALEAGAGMSDYSPRSLAHDGHAAPLRDVPIFAAGRAPLGWAPDVVCARIRRRRSRNR